MPLITIDLGTVGEQSGDTIRVAFTRCNSAITELNSHEADTANPHSVDKADVGLGSVENYGIATQAEAETGSSNVKYMTPLRVAQALALLDFLDLSETALQEVSGPVSFEDDVDVLGTLSKSAGSFRIPHPDPDKSDKELFHSFVESPTAGDNIYRWQVEVINGQVAIELPSYYQHLNETDMVWVNPVNHFGRAFGNVNQEQTHLLIKADSDGLYNVLLIGTRKDKIAKKAWKGTEREATKKS